MNALGALEKTDAALTKAVNDSDKKVRSAV